MVTTLEQRYNAKRNTLSLRIPPNNHATGSIIQPIMISTIAVGSSTEEDLKVRRKRWAACRSNRILQLLLTLPGLMCVVLLVMSGAGYIHHYYCQGMTDHTQESPESEKRRESLPERVEHEDNVGWLLPGVPKMFYVGTGAGESFGPPLTLPTPILVVGMPKTGTTSIRDFFRCNGHNASHWKCATPIMSNKMDGVPSLQKREKHAKYCAQVIKGNIEHNRPPLQGTGNYQVYAQMDVELPHETVFEGISRPFACYMPQVNDLEQLSASYPKATFILNTRNATAWVKSLRTFLEFDEKLKQCDLKGFPAGTGDTDEEFEAFFQNHAQNIRNFVKKHPSHTLIEVNIEDPNAGTQLAEAFGQSAECWVKRNAGAAQGP
eukprot:scaffold182005_cov59-Attheya_sp.AAC.2